MLVNQYCNSFQSYRGKEKEGKQERGKRECRNKRKKEVRGGRKSHSIAEGEKEDKREGKSRRDTLFKD